jgi:hypothetical protein
VYGRHRALVGDVWWRHMGVWEAQGSRGRRVVEAVRGSDAVHGPQGLEHRGSLSIRLFPPSGDSWAEQAQRLALAPGSWADSGSRDDWHALRSCL